jgi:hypothetical protein
MAEDLSARYDEARMNEDLRAADDAVAELVERVEQAERRVPPVNTLELQTIANERGLELLTKEAVKDLSRSVARRLELEQLVRETEVALRLLEIDFAHDHRHPLRSRRLRKRIRLIREGLVRPTR